MDKKQMPIGGEFWFQPFLQDEKNNDCIDNNGILLSGGKSAIEFILNIINFQEDEIILLPSYLCPTIVEFVKNSNVNYKFYDVNNGLNIDIDSIKNLVEENKVKAMFFINYYGFYHKQNVLEFIKGLKSKGIIIIEDAVQMFWTERKSNFIGDYIFNSYRKFLPIDGSLVISNEKLELDLDFIEDEYYIFMERARCNKTEYINSNVGNEEEFLSIFNLAHNSYYKRKKVYGIHKLHKEFLNKIPVRSLCEKRINNFKFLLNEIEKIPSIKTLYSDKDLNETVPLAFPILLSNRDYVRKELMKYNIYAPVHWNLKNEDWISNHPQSLKVSENILSLPIDWRYNIEDMEYMVKSLKVILNSN